MFCLGYPFWGSFLWRTQRKLSKIGGVPSISTYAVLQCSNFSACCLDVRTLTFCQLLGFPLNHLAGEQKATELSCSCLVSLSSLAKTRSKGACFFFGGGFWVGPPHRKKKCVLFFWLSRFRLVLLQHLKKKRRDLWGFPLGFPLKPTEARVPTRKRGEAGFVLHLSRGDLLANSGNKVRRPVVCRWYP